MTKAAISIPSDLLKQFDSIVSEKGYPSISEAIQDAVRRYIQHYGWMGEIEGERTGTIIVIYDGIKRGLIESIAKLQQDLNKSLLIWLTSIA